MTEQQYNDPSGNTEAFQAFVTRAATSEPEVSGAEGRSPIGIVIGVVAAAVIVAAVIWLVLAH